MLATQPYKWAPAVDNVVQYTSESYYNYMVHNGQYHIILYENIRLGTTILLM